MSLLYGVIGDYYKFRNYITKIALFLSDEERFEIQEYQNKNFIVGSVKPKKSDQPEHTKPSNLSIWYSGSIYSNTCDSKQSEEEIILEAYKKYGNKFGTALRGRFVVVIYDSNEKKIILSNDHFGLQPCYTLEKEDCLFFSSEMEAFTEAGLTGPQLDVDAIAELFITGSTVGERTLLNNVKRLGALSSIVVKNKKYSIKTQPLLLRAKIAAKTRMERYLDVHYLLNKSITSILKRAERKNEKLSLSLSGGLDSRLLLAHLIKNDAKFTAFTCRDPGATYRDDISYVKKLVSFFKIDHFFYKKNIGKATSFNVMLQNPSWNYVKQPEMSGYAGEILKGQYHKRVRITDNNQQQLILKRLFSKSFIKKLTSNPNDFVLRELKKVNNPCPQKRKELFFINHLGSSFRSEQPPLHRPKHLFLNDSYYPFLDFDLIEYITDIPMIDLHYNRFFVDFFTTMYPKYASIPSTTMDRRSVIVKEQYDSRKTLNEKQYEIYIEKYKDFSPLWQLNIFTGNFESKNEKILMCLFNVWHDFYFHHHESIYNMKTNENEWLYSQVKTTK